ncbi:peptide-methionine (R)-S-oxide reductase MsrB [Candidatus Uabimicrobium sp. HlEnr_7]|uniref:peptide-methionine (R)-S-oxide reductase MsrB n=1 Tax=Candidatus Uabimicrobium helgolandensis TaxID=3095367 RepID=UPI0035582D38
MSRIIILMFAFFVACSHSNSQAANNKKKKNNPDVKKITKTEKEWKEILTKDQYYVLREKGTESRYKGYWNSKEKGIYQCAACSTPLFSSETKYKSGTGWPSFWQPIVDKNVGEIEDRSLGMTRVEVVCNVCDSHLGHVFNDGPRPTGMRYCINSISLKLQKGVSQLPKKTEAKVEKKEAKVEEMEPSKK